MHYVYVFGCNWARFLFVYLLVIVCACYCRIAHMPLWVCLYTRVLGETVKYDHMNAMDYSYVHEAIETMLGLSIHQACTQNIWKMMMNNIRCGIIVCVYV